MQVTVCALLVAVFVAVASARTFDPVAMRPGGWYEEGRVSDPTMVSLRFALRERNVKTIKQIALDVSDPTSPRYGKYLTHEQIEHLTRPAEEDFQTVIQWLEAAGAVDVHISGDSIVAQMSVATASSAMETSFYHVANMHTKQTAMRARAFTLPTSISKSVEAVFGMHGLPLPPPKRASVNAAAPNPVDVTPDVINQVYKVSGVTVDRTSNKNRQAVAEFQGQLMEPKDLVTFFEKYVKSAQTGDDKVYKFEGTSQSGEGVEAQLDIQYIMGVAPGIKTEFWEQMNSDFCADLKNWTSVLLSTKDIPNVHSVSYGWQGNLTQIQCTTPEVTDVDHDFSKLAAAGITIIFASGDSGSGYTSAATCSPSDPGSVGQALQGQIIGEAPARDAFECCEFAANYAGFTFEAPQNCSIFKTVSGKVKNPKATSGEASHNGILWPSWPASSPWVTAVGATRFISNVVAPGAERAVDRFGSGGGFSSQFGRATWQASFVESFFTNYPGKLPPANEYSAKGRGTPDVSALGDGYQVINGGQPILVGGTSASAPCFAGLVSLLNEARIAKGKAPLGFLNQFIYQNSKAFTDVVVGSDYVGRGGETLAEGFNCTKGWDPITGVGTPVFPTLLEAALAAP